MNLQLITKRVSPEHDFDAVCFEVFDRDRNEVLFKTEDHDYAQAVVTACNSSEWLANGVKRRDEQIGRYKARYRDAVETLRCIAVCGMASDCGLCKQAGTCPSKTLVTLARRQLLQFGVKAERPAKPTGKKKGAEK